MYFNILLFFIIFDYKYKNIIIIFKSEYVFISEYVFLKKTEKLDFLTKE